jgi:putative hydrolase of the HAD superfamily
MRAMISLVLFDLDDTLYPRSSGVMTAISDRITDYLIERVGVPASEAHAKRAYFRGTYGTALRGLVEEGFPLDMDDYFDFVHDVPLDTIKPSAALRARLLALPARRAVLTNSNIEHAERVLAHMNLRNCFERVVDIRALDYVNKPDPESYRRTLMMLGASAGETIFVEDNTHNTGPAKAMGMTTIVIDHPLDADADYAVPTLDDALDLIERLLA